MAWLLECAGFTTRLVGTDRYCGGWGRGTFCHNAVGILGREVVWCGLFIVFGLFTMDAPIQSIEIQQEQPTKSRSKLVMYGFLINMSNPKAIVFLLAVLPQFLDLSKPQWSQYAVMAVTMVTIDLIVMAGYTGLAAKVLKLLKSPRQQKYLNRTFAVLFACAASLLSLVHQ